MATLTLKGFVLAATFRFASSCAALALAASFTCWRSFFSFNFAAYRSLKRRPRHTRTLGWCQTDDDDERNIHDSPSVQSLTDPARTSPYIESPIVRATIDGTPDLHEELHWARAIFAECGCDRWFRRGQEGLWHNATSTIQRAVLDTYGEGYIVQGDRQSEIRLRQEYLRKSVAGRQVYQAGRMSRRRSRSPHRLNPTNPPHALVPWQL